MGHGHCHALRHDRARLYANAGVPAQHGPTEQVHVGETDANGDATPSTRILPPDAPSSGCALAQQADRHDVAHAAGGGGLVHQRALVAPRELPPPCGEGLHGATLPQPARRRIRAHRAGAESAPLHHTRRPRAVRRTRAALRHGVGRGYDPRVGAPAQQVLGTCDDLPRGVHYLARGAARARSPLSAHVAPDQASRLQARFPSGDHLPRDHRQKSRKGRVRGC
mmetsp:Transcript_20669/g.35341  ORF Transcript_20669/g.35341 Transcript_20669/m.35341 type:complete len:223 (+) Transcript_20669:1141-1809(+)